MAAQKQPRRKFDKSQETLKWSDQQIKAWNARMKEYRTAAGLETKPVARRVAPVVPAVTPRFAASTLNWWD